MANGRMPFDAKVAAADAALLDTIDKLPFVAFVDGSDKGDDQAPSPRSGSSARSSTPRH